jgi:hypothetical protein
MQNIYEQVEKLLKEDQSKPAWADEILRELKEIKQLLHSQTKTGSKSDRSDYFAFVKKLRKELRADLINNIYPEIDYQGRKLGINLKGYIYDKATTQDLPAYEAFAVYRFLYEKRDNLDKYLKK